MADERDPESKHNVHGLLDDWREAERDEQAETPVSAARDMAHKRSNVARRDFHEAEDEERERQGDDTPRKHPDPPPG